MLKFLLIICIGILGGIVLAPIIWGALYLLRPLLELLRAMVHPEVRDRDAIASRAAVTSAKQLQVHPAELQAKSRRTLGSRQQAVQLLLQDAISEYLKSFVRIQSVANPPSVFNPYQRVLAAKLRAFTSSAGVNQPIEKTSWETIYLLTRRTPDYAVEPMQPQHVTAVIFSGLMPLWKYKKRNCKGFYFKPRYQLLDRREVFLLHQICRL
jgi:hypothetical protein